MIDFDKVASWSDRQLGDVYDCIATLIYYGVSSRDEEILYQYLEEELEDRDLLTDGEVEWTEICTREAQDDKE